MARSMGYDVTIRYVGHQAAAIRFMDHEPAREARTKSVKYFRKALGSRSRIFVANSMAVDCGQFWDGRKTVTKKSKASWPRVFETVWRKLAISWRTCKGLRT